MNTIERTGPLIDYVDSKKPIYELTLRESAEFIELEIDYLIDLIIYEYHFNARENVAVIYDLAQKLFCRHNGKHPELSKYVETLFLFFDDLLFHLKKEEQIIFPKIIQLTEKKLQEGTFNYSTLEIIKEYSITMQNEHRDIVNQLEFFRRLTNNYTLPEDCSKTYQSLFTKMKEFENEMIQHIQVEDNFLFPRAIQMAENLTVKKK